MIVRVRHDDHFTIVRNQSVRDHRLSYKATGLLVYLLSLPDDTRITREELAGCKRDGKESVRTALQELARAGYLERTVTRLPNGRRITETTLSEVSTSATTARFSTARKTSASKSGTLRSNKGGAARKARADPEKYFCAACGERASRMAADATWWCDAHVSEYARRSRVPPAKEA